MTLPLRPMVRARSDPRQHLDFTMCKVPWGNGMPPQSHVGAKSLVKKVSREVAGCP